MAKYLKSIFYTPEKQKSSSRYEGDADEEKTESPATCDRRKLSISRSGRLRQANRKRHSLSLEVYRGDLQQADKPKSIEYHVQSPVTPTPPVSDKKQRRRNTDDRGSEDYESIKSSDKDSELSELANPKEQNTSTGEKSPEEEIDIAFEIIDKS